MQDTTRAWLENLPPPENALEKDLRAAQWFALSDQNLKDARTLQNAGSYASACFHAQQAVLMALNGFLLVSDGQAKRAHSIGEVVGKELAREEFAQFEPERLDRYYWGTRDPEAYEPSAIILRIFGRRDAEDAIRAAEGTIDILRNWAKELGFVRAD